mmetsp:Transcript_38514/g.66522  ORF Transcript_38514/g.66522 Transcript_38514/m.66522 type:complete len:242 (+) Transcript_38514:251-976(+)
MRCCRRSAKEGLLGSFFGSTLASCDLLKIPNLPSLLSLPSFLIVNLARLWLCTVVSASFFPFFAYSSLFFLMSGSSSQRGGTNAAMSRCISATPFFSCADKASTGNMEWYNAGSLSDTVRDTSVIRRHNSGRSTRSHLVSTICSFQPKYRLSSFVAFPDKVIGGGTDVADASTSLPGATAGVGRMSCNSLLSGPPKAATFSMRWRCKSCKNIMSEAFSPCRPSSSNITRLRTLFLSTLLTR